MHSRTILCELFFYRVLRPPIAFRPIHCRHICFRQSYAAPETFGLPATRRHMPPQPTYEALEKRIRELEPAEASLRASEALFRSMVETSPLGIAIVNDQFQYTYINKEFCRISGYAEKDILGADFFFVLAEESKQLAIDRYVRRQRGESVPDRYEVTFIKKDRTRRIAEVQSTVFIDADQRANSLLQVYDITDRKQAEDALKESEKKYRALVENAGEAIFVAQDGKLKFTNPRTETLTGYSGETLKTRSFVEFIHPDDRAMVLERHTRRMQGEDLPPQYAFRIVTAGQNVRWVELNVVAIEWDGAPATLNFVTDITERKKAEAEKEKVQELLNQSQKMESIGRLAGGVAHDFNNMLGVIIGQADLAIKKMAKPDHPDPAHPLFSSIAEIQRAAVRAAELTRQLLAFARKQTISPKQLLLNDTVGSMISMLRRLIGEDIHLIWKPGAHLWPVKMDPAQVDQILANLCVNARDAINGVGHILIRTANISVDDAFCTRHPDGVPGDYVRLSVEDDGCGMDTEIREKLFEPFFTTKAMGEGTGLGLSMIYGIIRQNNGFIGVASTPGKGTVFDIYLPRDTGPPVPDPEIGRRTTSGGTETILVVEDEAAILEMVRDMLENMGYQVLTANTPARALDIGKAHPDHISLLMTDVIMPEMNGKDLARRLTAAHPGLKTLFMSGYTADVIAHHGILEENVAFIQKPFSMNELAKRLRDVLDR